MPDISVISGILVCRAQETNVLCPQAGGGGGHDEDGKLQQDGAVLEDMNAGDSDSKIRMMKFMIVQVSTCRTFSFQ